jgi:hypothetical protein
MQQYPGAHGTRLPTFAVLHVSVSDRVPLQELPKHTSTNWSDALGLLGLIAVQ